MSYVQIEIGGKLRGLKFNKMAQLVIHEKVKPGNLMSGIYALIYAGLISNDYVKGNEPDYTFEQVCDWADELKDETLLKIQEAYQQTEAYKLSQAYLEDTKKKEKSNHSKNTKQKALK